MVILSRFLMGAAFKMLFGVSLTYIANKESNYDRAYKELNTKHTDVVDEDVNINHSGEKVKNRIDEGSRIKKTAYILLSFCTNFPSVIGPGT